MWAADIIWRENLLSISHFWNGYPHVNMTFMFKFFFIVQVISLTTIALRFDVSVFGTKGEQSFE